MLEYRLHAQLRAYIHGTYALKVSELENDVPLLETRPQMLTEEQKRQSLINQDATRILSENFVRWDMETALTEGQRSQARLNIGAVNQAEVENQVNLLDEKLQTNINEEIRIRAEADELINNYLDPDIALQGFVVGDTVTTALNELKKGFDNCVDNNTIVKIETDDPEIEKLGAIAIQDSIAGGIQRKVVPQDIVDLESRVTGAEGEIKKMVSHGGSIAPYNFGWDGLISTTVQIGDTFQEQFPYDPMRRRTITIVDEGQDNYPSGSNISVRDVKEKVQRFQTDLTAWATEDIWNETYTRYGEDPLPFTLARKKAITISIGKGLNTSLPVGYWESIAMDTHYHLGLWVTDGGVGGQRLNIGRFLLSGEIVNEWASTPAASFDMVDEWAPATVTLWNDEMYTSDITFHEPITNGIEGEEGEEPIKSGIDWEESLIYWKGRSPRELLTGTRAINLFNGWAYELVNTHKTDSVIFKWGLSDIGEEKIGYANDETAGFVKTRYSIVDHSQTPVYGVLLDENKQMYVDGLGADIMVLREEQDASAQTQADRETELQDLYETLIAEGWII